MSILAASHSSTVHEAALAYLAMGISVLPVRGKEPAVNWKPFQTHRTSPAMVEQWSSMGLLSGVGIICGGVSRNLVVIDLDGEKAIEAFSIQFPHLLDTYTITSGSGKGAHLYYQPLLLPSTTRVVGVSYGNVELRANGCYVVAPPSIHPSGKPYTVSNAVPVLKLPNLGDVSVWIKTLMAAKHGGVMPPPTARPVDRVSAWAQAALSAECKAVQYASAGARNNTLNRAAFKMAQLVRDGKLTREDVEAALYGASTALIQSDGISTVTKTIKSGIEAGLSKPDWRVNRDQKTANHE